jgi:hypothetical protein
VVELVVEVLHVDHGGAEALAVAEGGEALGGGHEAGGRDDDPVRAMGGGLPV